MKRFQFTPFWRMTSWGFVSKPWRLQKGCDEYHNKSRFLIVPLFGGFVLFDKNYDTIQPEHLFSYIDGAWNGVDVPGCSICAEIKEDF